MPCHLIQKVAVKFTAKHRKLLDEAVKTLGWQLTENKWSGEIVVTTKKWNQISLNLSEEKATYRQGRDAEVNELKRAYTNEALKLGADMIGWKNQITGSNKGLLLKGSL
jgi:hypothetical protein